MTPSTTSTAATATGLGGGSLETEGVSHHHQHQESPRGEEEDAEVRTEINVDAAAVTGGGGASSANDRNVIATQEAGEDSKKDDNDAATTTLPFPSSPENNRKAPCGTNARGQSKKSLSPRSSTWISGGSLMSPRRSSTPSPSSGDKKKLSLGSASIGRFSLLSLSLQRQGERTERHAGGEQSAAPEIHCHDDPADAESGFLGGDSATLALSIATATTTTLLTSTSSTGERSVANRNSKVRRPSTSGYGTIIEPGAVRVRGIHHPGGDESSSKFDDDPVVLVQTSTTTAATATTTTTDLETIESGAFSLASTGAASIASSFAPANVRVTGATGLDEEENQHPHQGLVAATAVTRDDLEQEVRDRILREAVVAEVAVDVGGPPQETALEKIAEMKKRKILCLIGLVVITVVAIASGTLGVVLGSERSAGGGSNATTTPEPPRVWTPEELKQFIISELGTSRGFELTGFTPAKVAYDLILDGNTFNNVSLGTQVMDAFVLLALWSGTGGKDGWTRSDLWNEVPNPCEWFGIMCNQKGRVNGISLPSNNVVGPFNPDLQYLRDEVTYMDFSDNQVALFKFNLTLLTSLVHLNLSRNDINRKSLESSMEYNLTKLEVLDLSFNILTGPILPEIARLSNLRELHLQENMLTGPVPSELASLVNLSSLRLDGNQLSGSIPDGVCASNVSTLSGLPPAKIYVDCEKVTCACCQCEVSS